MAQQVRRFHCYQRGIGGFFLNARVGLFVVFGGQTEC